MKYDLRAANQRRDRVIAAYILAVQFNLGPDFFEILLASAQKIVNHRDLPGTLL